MSIVIRIRRGSSSQWASSTKVLQIGELGIDTTLNKIKAGNGSSLWSALPWLTITPDEITTQVSGAVTTANLYTDTAVSSLGNSISGQYVEVGDVGVADGVASLGPDGKIPDSEIPDGIARDTEIITSYNDLTDKPSIALGAVKWTANHYQLTGGENTRYLTGDIVWDGGNIYVANYDNESIPTSSTLYWTNIGAGKRLNIDGRDIPNIIWDNILQKPTLFSGSYDDLTNKPTIPSLTGYATETYVNTAVSNLVDSAPETLNTLNELAAALGDDANYATTISTALGNKLDSSTAASTYLTQSNASSTYAPIASPTFTGTVSGITASMVGLGSVDNTSDSNKPVSTATQTALDLKLNISEPSIDYYITNSGSGAYLVNGISNGTIYFEKGKKYRIHVNANGHPFWIQTVSGGYSSANVYNAGIANNGTQNGHIIIELAQDAPQLYYACQYHSSMAGSIFVGSRSTTSKAIADLSNVDNTSDVNKPISTATQTALDLKSDEKISYVSESGTSRTISASDLYKVIHTSSGSNVTITIPNDVGDVLFPIGSYLEIRQMGAGQVTVSVTSPATAVAPDNAFKTRVQYSSIVVEKHATNSWYVTGDTTA